MKPTENSSDSAHPGCQESAATLSSRISQGFARHDRFSVGDFVIFGNKVDFLRVLPGSSTEKPSLWPNPFEIRELKNASDLRYSALSIAAEFFRKLDLLPGLVFGQNSEKTWSFSSVFFEGFSSAFKGAVFIQYYESLIIRIVFCSHILTILYNFMHEPFARNFVL